MLFLYVENDKYLKTSKNWSGNCLNLHAWKISLYFTENSKNFDVIFNLVQKLWILAQSNHNKYLIFEIAFGLECRDHILEA